MDSLNVLAYSLSQTVTVNTHLLHIKNDNISQINVTKRLPIPNIFEFVIAQQCVFLQSSVCLGV